MISCSLMADIPTQLQKWERRLAHLVGIYCKKKERWRGREEGREKEREGGRRCEYKSTEKGSNLLSHYLPKPVT